jgi:protein-S-isoprenylcysteine O-methyltransferase Ste14
MNSLFLRALLAFLALPGTVAFLVPLLLLMPRSFVNRWAVIPLGLGSVLLLSCVREFYVAGRGTLAPWAPPRNLVVTGPYRFSRNPMYIAVLLVLWGWSLAFQSRSHATYAAVMTILFHLRVVLFEEPWLDQTHGEEWVRYKAAVSRWFGTHKQQDARTNTDARRVSTGQPLG